MLEDMVTPDHKHTDSLPLIHSVIVIWVILPQMLRWYNPNADALHCNTGKDKEI